MDHKELHDALSEDLKALREGTLKPQLAREIFNGAGKIIANCKNELIAINMGFNCDVPLLGIKESECRKTHTLNNKILELEKNKK